jgi:superfamily II DNA or RNA helicase
MATIHLEYQDATYFRIHSDNGTIRELSDVLTFTVQNYQFMKKYKMGLWDGKIRLVNVRNNTVYVGLIGEIIRFCREREYKLTVDSVFTSFMKESFEAQWSFLNLPFPPRDFQETAVNLITNKKRTLIVSSTGSGKSLIIYSAIRNILKEASRVLLVVPSISLVNQMVSDFKDYSKNDDWDVDENVQKIMGGESKIITKPITVSTWQSIYKLPQDYFDVFDAVIADEVHSFTAEAASKIMEKSTNAHIRAGLTGTLKETVTDKLVLTGLFGPPHTVTKTADLIERGILAKLKIKPIVLKYSKETQDACKGIKYQDEMNYICQHERRNKFIVDMVDRIQGNTLVLFQYVEKHGKVLEKLMKERSKDVFFVYGGTDADQREAVRKICEQRRDVIVLASYGVFQQGVSITNLDYVVFASPSKSKIRVFQSIGRGLRVGKEKTKCVLIDIADDLVPNLKSKNHTLKHFAKRYEYYVQESFDIDNIKSITIE